METPRHNFCHHCGHALKTNCPHCHQNVINSNFCEACGEILHGMWLIKKNHIDKYGVLQSELLPKEYSKRQDAELDAQALTTSDPFHDYIVIAILVDENDESLEILVARALVDGKFSEIFNSRKISST